MQENHSVIYAHKEQEGREHMLLAPTGEGEGELLCLAAWDTQEQKLEEGVRIAWNMLVEHPQASSELVFGFLHDHTLADLGDKDEWLSLIDVLHSKLNKHE